MQLLVPQQVYSAYSQGALVPGPWVLNMWSGISRTKHAVLVMGKSACIWPAAPALYCMPQHWKVSALASMEHAASQPAPVDLKLRPMWRVLILLFEGKFFLPGSCASTLGLSWVGVRLVMDCDPALFGLPCLDCLGLAGVGCRFVPPLDCLGSFVGLLLGGFPPVACLG